MAEPMKKRPWQGFLLEKPLAAFSPLPVFVSTPPIRETVMLGCESGRKLRNFVL